MRWSLFSLFDRKPSEINTIVQAVERTLADERMLARLSKREAMDRLFETMMDRPEKTPK